MKISNDAINNVLGLQSIEEPVIHCIVNKELLGDVRQSIISYSKNSKVTDEENNIYFKSLNFDGLLISLDATNNDNILAIEKYLILQNKKRKTIMLDIKEVNRSIDKRDLVLSFLNRYNVDIIKGTKEEVTSLINGQKYSKNSLKDKYRDFSRKYRTILVIKDNGELITDGYSEFIIKSEDGNLLDEYNLDNILSSMMVVSTSIFNNKEEKIGAILIATVAFEMCKKLTLAKKDNDDFRASLLEEISNIDGYELYKFNDIRYTFVR